jgi:hypothetical protein
MNVTRVTGERKESEDIGFPGLALGFSLQVYSVFFLCVTLCPLWLKAVDFDF